MGYHLTVYVGDWDNDEVDVGEFQVQPEEMIIHENYGAVNGIANDVCLLRVPTLASQKFGFNQLLIFFSFLLPVFNR